MQISRPNLQVTENNHFGADRMKPHTPMDRVTDEAMTEITVLKQNGLDVDIVPIDLSGHYQLADEKQRLVNHAIDTYSEVPNFASELVKANPAVDGWLAMAKSMSPLALTFFYNTGNMERPSDGLSRQAILDTPLPIGGGKTATEMVLEMKEKKDADIIIDRTTAFFEAGSLKDGIDNFGLTAHDIMAGSLDRIGDITRAKTAIAMVRNYVQTHPERYTDRGVVTASFASGAAEPMFWLLDQLRRDGLQIDAAHQVDLDPIALAASADRSTHYSLNDKIVMHHEDLLRGPQADTYIEPHSVDFLDAIGIVEYLSPVLATRLLKNAASVVRPGGMIVFGNMLKSRPQQLWFDGLWPKLRQRSISEVLTIIENAGFSNDMVEVRLSKDGLYPMYGIKIPLEASHEAPETKIDTKRALGHTAYPKSI